jgi:hypothetical protein
VDDAGEDDSEAPATHVPSTSTTTTMVQDGPSPTPPTIQQDQVEVAAEGGGCLPARGTEARAS